MQPYFSPRWLYKRVSMPGVVGGTTVQLNASDFANTEIFDMHLQWLCVTGRPNAAATTANFVTAQGGVRRRTQIQLGLSQQGDINTVPSNMTAMMAPDVPYKQAFAQSQGAVRLDLPYSYELPPDAGFVVTTKNNDGSGNACTYPTVALLGHINDRENNKAPRIMSAVGPDTLADGASHNFDAADLWNDGIDSIIVNSLTLSDASHPAGAGANFALTGTSWLINPSTGLEWMPTTRGPIPAGCIAPFNRISNDVLDQAPSIFRFGGNVILRPRQRLSIELQSLANAVETYDICLFGMLEVQ